VNNELLYEVNDGIAVITINRPERRNALNRAVREGFFRGLAPLRSRRAGPGGHPHRGR